MFECNLPWPPSVNSYYTVWKGRKILSKKGKQFKADCSIYIYRNGPQLTGDLSVEISVCMPDKRRRDLDNLLKPILDVLGNYGVYEDDSQIVDLRIKKIDANKGDVVVKIKRLMEKEQ